ncbi:T9SS type A sorting domain-containing protein [bacterium]|nr:T9SS type A sorting domain-containing protein [bacterium]
MRNVILLICMALTVLYGQAQYLPNDLNSLLMPVQEPLNLPQYGITWMYKYSDSAVFQETDGSGGWTDTAQFTYLKNKHKELIKLELKSVDASNWVTQILYPISRAYNSNNQLIAHRMQLSYGGNSIIYSSQLSYNSSNLLEKCLETDSFYVPSPGIWSAMQVRYTISYNGSNQRTEVLKERAAPAGGTFTNDKKWTYKYDANGNCTQIIEQLYNSGWEDDERYTYSYNSSNQMEQITHEYYDGSNWVKIDNEYFFTWNNGLLSRVEEIEQQNGEDEAYDFVYDANGVLTEMYSAKKTMGTSTWNKESKAMHYYDANGQLSYSLEYKYLSGAYEKEAGGRVLYQAVSGGSTPAEPSNLKVSTNKKEGAKLYLSWTDNSNNETGFNIYRSSDSVSFSLIGNVAENVINYTDTGLMADNKYFYKVSAYNSAGESGASNVAGGKTTATSIGYLTENQLDIYPNPCTNTVFLNGLAHNSMVKIFDLSGTLALQKASSGTSMQLDLHHLPNGTYMIYIETKGAIEHGLLIKH